MPNRWLRREPLVERRLVRSAHASGVLHPVLVTRAALNQTSLTIYVNCRRKRVLSAPPPGLAGDLTRRPCHIGTGPPTRAHVTQPSHVPHHSQMTLYGHRSSAKGCPRCQGLACSLVHGLLVTDDLTESWPCPHLRGPVGQGPCAESVRHALPDRTMLHGHPRTPFPRGPSSPCMNRTVTTGHRRRS